MKHIIEGKEVDIKWDRLELIDNHEYGCSDWIVQGEDENGVEYFGDGNYQYGELIEVIEITSIKDTITMKKTAEDYLNDAYKIIEAKQSSAHEDVYPVLLKAMKLYAKQVAQQALKDAASRASLIYESDNTGNISHYGRSYGTEKGEVRVDVKSILSTPIKKSLSC